MKLARILEWSVEKKDGQAQKKQTKRTISVLLMQKKFWKWLPQDLVSQ